MAGNEVRRKTFDEPSNPFCNFAEALPAMLSIVGEKSGLPKEKNATGKPRFSGRSEETEGQNNR